MTYFAYLDEFGHIGPYVSREDPKHNDSPVFGLAGFVLPSERVRGFGTWFFKRKCQLLERDIEESGQHPARWEKKGSRLYTVRNIKRYPALGSLLDDSSTRLMSLRASFSMLDSRKLIHQTSTIQTGYTGEFFVKLSNASTNSVPKIVILLPISY
ncbi:DUF3800 domain-containing protein [Candidatus Palauibacter sp.]|uniref:DUF3800 domain-containing protein n=1 Tax=Candidatus Palauibacter sp. TaxID=3101350 RepID=UPI003B5C38D5